MEDTTQKTHLVHQIMIVDGFDLPMVLPSTVEQNASALRQLYPHAKYRLWDGKALREVIAENFDADILNAFDTLRPYSYKCNIGRYCLLYLFGGLYVDLGIRGMNALRPPEDVGLATFRDCDLASPCWSAMSTSVIWARPGRKEFRIALDYIVENCKTKYYGKNPLYVSGPVVWGRAIVAAKAEKRQGADADDQWIGVCRLMTPDQKQQNICFVAPDHSFTALRMKGTGGDLANLGCTGTNNYNFFWHTRRVYGEKETRWLFDNTEICLTNNAKRTPTGIGSVAAATGMLTFGPYMMLEPGNYRFSISLRRLSKKPLPGMRIDIAYGGGTQLYACDFDEAIHIDSELAEFEFEFTISELLESVEFRFYAFGEFGAEIVEYSVRQIPNLTISQASQGMTRVPHPERQ